MSILQLVINPMLLKKIQVIRLPATVYHYFNYFNYVQFKYGIDKTVCKFKDMTELPHFVGNFPKVRQFQKAHGPNR